LGYPPRMGFLLHVRSLWWLQARRYHGGSGPGHQPLRRRHEALWRGRGASLHVERGRDRGGAGLRVPPAVPGQAARRAERRASPRWQHAISGARHFPHRDGAAGTLQGRRGRVPVLPQLRGPGAAGRPVLLHGQGQQAGDDPRRAGREHAPLFAPRLPGDDTRGLSAYLDVGGGLARSCCRWSLPQR